MELSRCDVCKFRLVEVDLENDISVFVHVPTGVCYIRRYKESFNVMLDAEGKPVTLKKSDLEYFTL